MTSAADPPGWAVRLNRRDARRRSRCRVCGHRRVIDTESGPHCEAHAAQLPPPLPHHHDQDQPMTTDTDHPADCTHDWCIAPHEQMCDCPFSNAQPHKRDRCKYARDLEADEQ